MIGSGRTESEYVFKFEVQGFCLDLVGSRYLDPVDNFIITTSIAINIIIIITIQNKQLSIIQKH